MGQAVVPGGFLIAKTPRSSLNDEAFFVDQQSMVFSTPVGL